MPLADPPSFSLIFAVKRLAGLGSFCGDFSEEYVCESHPASLRYFTAVCSFQNFPSPYTPIGLPLLVVTISFQGDCFGIFASSSSTQTSSATLPLVQIRLCFLTFVRYGMISILVLAPIPNFVVVRFITALCRLFIFNLVIGSVILVSLSWWQFERKLIDKYPLLNLVILGIWYPSISVMEKVLFPKFPPLWSGLDVQASPVLQGSFSWLMVLSAFDEIM